MSTEYEVKPYGVVDPANAVIEALHEGVDTVKYAVRKDESNKSDDCINEEQNQSPTEDVLPPLDASNMLEILFNENILRKLGESYTSIISNRLNHIDRNKTYLPLKVDKQYTSVFKDSKEILNSLGTRGYIRFSRYIISKSKRFGPYRCYKYQDGCRMYFTTFCKSAYDTGTNKLVTYELADTMYFFGPNAYKHKLKLYNKFPDIVVLSILLYDPDKEKVKSLDLLYFPFKDKLKEYLSAWKKVGDILAKKNQGTSKASYMTSFLFYGEPGTGKSSIAQAIVDFLGYKRDNIDFSKPLRPQFEAIKDNTVVVMEELDCVMGARNAEGKVIMTEENMKNLRELLILLDGKEIVYKNVVFIATTNYLDNLDVALKRDGRFNYKYECKRLNKEGVAYVCKSRGFNPKPFLDAYVKPVLPSNLIRFLDEQTIFRMQRHYDLLQEFKQYELANNQNQINKQSKEE